jgi:hypothetical protein
MKRVLVSFLFFVSTVYGFAGFGGSVGVNSISQSPGSSPLMVDGNQVGSFEYKGFKSANYIGGYLYVDALPIVDVDLELNVKLAPYKFSFTNSLGTQDSLDFVWASSSFYLTLQKNLLKTSIPFIAKLKMFAGAGINSHQSTPMINQDMLETILDGDLENGEFSGDEALEYLNENKIESSGIHFQIGAQFKLLIFDSQLILRQVMAKDLTPDTNGFTHIGLRFGYGL